MSQIDLDAYLALVGTELGHSEWMLIDQERIDRFAEVTGDFQFIHVDPERAAAGPFGGTIAHGFLTLSLLAPMLAGMLPALANRKFAMNYGFERIRFLAPVRSGSRVRTRCTIASVEQRKPGEILTRVAVLMEADTAGGPVLVAEWLGLSVL